jgi:DNA replicative helicase MCM subunit Mcm2 (Cdc46/Mcm family)
MGTESLRCLAKEQGIDEQRSDEIIEKLTDAGEIYKPSAGRLCIA